MKFLTYIWQRGIVSAFLTGLFVLLPVVLTFLIIEWLVTKLSSAFGPGTVLGDLMTSGGTTIVGPSHSVLAFWLGVLIALGGVWALGVLVKTQARRQVDTLIDTLFSRVPLVKSIYRPVSQVVRLLNVENQDEFKGMSVVMVRFGGETGAEVLALLTTKSIYEVNGKRRQLVYLPTSPLPMTGGLVFVAEDSIAPVPGMNVEDLMKVYFSLGALMPEDKAAALKRIAKTPPQKTNTPI